MIYRLFFIFCIILTSCKKAEDDKPYNIMISGLVNDQINGRAVEGASVSMGTQMIAYPFEGLIVPAQSTTTDQDGRFNLKTSVMPYNTKSVSPGSYFRVSIALYASKPGYIGSNRPEMHYYGAQSSVMNLQLYHSSELHLHLLNDTNNNVDSVDVKLGKLLPFSRIPVMTKACYKKNMDSTFVINNLFGNWE